MQRTHVYVSARVVHAHTPVKPAACVQRRRGSTEPNVLYRPRYWSKYSDAFTYLKTRAGLMCRRNGQLSPFSVSSPSRSPLSRGRERGAGSGFRQSNRGRGRPFSSWRQVILNFETRVTRYARRGFLNLVSLIFKFKRRKCNCSEDRVVWELLSGEQIGG